MISATHLTSEVINPVLEHLERVKPGMNRPAAGMLLLGTAAQESDLGFFLRQHPTGPARGVWQMERATVIDIWDRYLEKPGNEELRDVVYGFWTGGEHPADEITWNLKLACALARIRYWMVPIPIPSDLVGQARYWDVYYNANDKDEQAEYLASYEEFVMAGFL